MAKVVHFAKFYRPDKGGIESVTAMLAAGAARAGHAVRAICFRRSPAPANDRLDGVRVMRLAALATIASQPLSLRYVLACVRHGRCADVVHVHLPNMLAAFACLLLGTRPRLVLHWHSDVIQKGALGMLLQPLERAMLARADAVITTSSAYAAASAMLAPVRSKVAVVPIGVPDPAARQAASAELYPELQRKHIVLAVGRLVPYKGFVHLVRAARDLGDDTIVVIVGDGPCAAELHEVVRAEGLAGKVHLAGRLSDEELDALYARADLFCLPSVERSEAFGVVLVEAMARRLPIVATNIPGSGVPWVNEHGVSGFNVPVGDAAALAEACRHILDDPAERARLSQGARSRFLSLFTAEASIASTLQLYERLLTEA